MKQGDNQDDGRKTRVHNSHHDDPLPDSRLNTRAGPIQGEPDQNREERDLESDVGNDEGHDQLRNVDDLRGLLGIVLQR